MNAPQRQWALGIGHSHRTQTAPAWGFWEGEGARASRSAATGLVLYRIRRADKEVSCISCPYWRQLLPVKGLPHPSRLPFHGTLPFTHSLPAGTEIAHALYTANP